MGPVRFSESGLRWDELHILLCGNIGLSVSWQNHQASTSIGWFMGRSCNGYTYNTYEHEVLQMIFRGDRPPDQVVNHIGAIRFDNRLSKL